MGFWDRLSPPRFRRTTTPAFPFGATYVITLEDSRERWQHMTRVIERTALRHVVRWSGVDGRRLDDEFVQTLQAVGVLATDFSRFTAGAVKGEIGCALSHFGVLTDIVRRGLSHALILEDDVVPSGSDADWYERFLRAYGDLPRAWEVWFLYRCHDRQDKIRRRTSRTVIPYHPYGAAAYAVSRRGAEKLLRAARPIDRPIDCIVAEELVSTRRIKAYAASPLLFRSGNHPSIIHADNPARPWTIDGVVQPPEVGW